MSDVFLGTLVLFLVLGSAVVAVGLITQLLLRIEEWLDERERARKARRKARDRRG